MIDYIRDFRDALLALDRFDACRTLVAMTAGVLTCAVGPLFHELWHLLPARLFSGAGKLLLFPFRHIGGMRAWIIVFAIDVPDMRFRTLSSFQTGVIIAAGPAADFTFMLDCAALWPLASEPVGVGIAAGFVARAAVWHLNVIPIPSLGNDRVRFLEFVWKRA